MKKYVLATVVALSALTPAFAEAPKLPVPTMAIKGEGEHYVKPDYATFTLAVETRHAVADKTTTTHAAKIESIAKVLDGLKDEGVSVKSANFTQRVEQKMQRTPVDSYRSVEKPIGAPEHVARTDYTLKTRKLDIPSLNKVVSLLANGDLYDLSRLSFFHDQPRKAALEARRKAVQDAREQAEVYADAANIKLIEIADITDADAADYRNGGPDGQADLPRRRAEAGKWVKVSDIVPPETIRFPASVNILWRIGPTN